MNDDRGSEPHPIVPVLEALARVEGESLLKHELVRSLGFQRHADIMEFLPGWLQQEQEHARALRDLLQESFGPMEGRRDQAVPPPEMAPIEASFSRKVAARLLPGADTTYLVIGATAEYTARLVYSWLADWMFAQSEHAAQVLRGIARQEAQHLRFYAGAARLRLERSGACRFATARTLPRVWSPLGIDTLGLNHWRHTFAFLLDDQVFQERLFGVDRLVQSLPGLSNVYLMQSFLTSSCGYDRPLDEVRLRNRTTMSTFARSKSLGRRC